MPVSNAVTLFLYIVVKNLIFTTREPVCFYFERTHARVMGVVQRGRERI